MTNLRGTIYACTRCSCQLTVDFGVGVRPTPASDVSAGVLLSQFVGMPLYVHQRGLCDVCHELWTRRHTADAGGFERLVAVLTPFAALREAARDCLAKVLPGATQEWLEALTAARCEALAPDAWRATVGPSDFARGGARRRRALLDTFIREAGRALARDHDASVRSRPAVAAALADATARLSPLLVELQRLAAGGTSWRGHVSQCFGTTGVPGADRSTDAPRPLAQGFRFYVPRELSRKELDGFIRECGPDRLLEVHTRGVIGAVRARLVAITGCAASCTPPSATTH
jgi:hypothetical protein